MPTKARTGKSKHKQTTRLRYENLSKTLLLILIASTAFAQKTATFRIEFKPNTQYTIKMNVLSTIEINFEGDENTLSQMKQAGVTLPMMMEMKQNISSVMKTRQWSNEQLPLTLEYKDLETQQTLGGNPMPAQPNPLSGVMIDGHGDKQGKLHVDSISGGNANDQTKKLLSDMLEKMQTQVAFPEKPMRVGDSFTQDTPLEIPMQGGQTIKMIVKTEYKLKSFAEAIAVFDTFQTLSMDMTIDQGSAKGSGSGKGQMQFDRKQNYISNFTSVMDLTFGGQMGALNMTANSSSTTGLEVTFSGL